jgi:hypothetical protein
MWVSESSVHDYDVGWTAHVSTSVAVDHLDIIVFSKIPSGLLDQRLFTIDGNNGSCRANHFRQDGGIVASAAPDLHDALPLLNVKDIEQPRPKTRQPVIESPVLIDRHEHVVI